MPYKNIEDRKAFRNRMRQRVKDFILNFKKDRCCSECGYNEHPEILCFHHNQNNKKFEIGDRAGASIRAVEKEITKCILLCPNCHNWLHFKK